MTNFILIDKDTQQAMENFILVDKDIRQAIREQIAQGKPFIDFSDKAQVAFLANTLNAYQKSNTRIFTPANNLGYLGLFILALKATLAFLGL